MNTILFTIQVLKSQIHFGSWFVIRNTMIISVALLSLTGCSNFPNPQQAVMSEQRIILTPRNPILEFVEHALASGETGIINTPTNDTPVHVRADKVYNSASGYQCRRYYLSHPQETSIISSHLACNIDNQWSEVRQLLITDPNQNS